MNSIVNNILKVKYSKNIRIIVILSLIFLLSNCRKINIDEFPEIVLQYSELPLELQEIFLENLKPKQVTYEDGTIGMIYGFCRNDVVSLDGKYAIKYKYTGKAGVRPGNYEFKINYIIFYLTYNSNRWKPPFVLYKSKLYYILSAVYTEQEIKHGEYAYKDLSNYLNYAR